MKYLRCTQGSDELTEGKVYEIVKHIGNGVVQVVNDKGDKRAYYEHRFGFVDFGSVDKPRHKHADVIHAYAEGAEIQWRQDASYGWGELPSTPFPSCYAYRVKPELDDRLITSLETELHLIDNRRLEVEAELKIARGLS